MRTGALGNRDIYGNAPRAPTFPRCRQTWGRRSAGRLQPFCLCVRVCTAMRGPSCVSAHPAGRVVGMYGCSLREGTWVDDEEVVSIVNAGPSDRLGR